MFILLFCNPSNPMQYRANNNNYGNNNLQHGTNQS